MTTKSIVLILIISLSLVPLVEPFIGDVQDKAHHEYDGPEPIWDEMTIEKANDPLELSGNSFIENLGQMGPGHGMFFAKGVPFTIAFSPGYVSYILDGDGMRGDVSTFRVMFKDARPVRPEGLGELGGRMNYLIGNHPGDWYIGARSFEEVRYADLWDGIDLRFYFEGGLLKYVFDVQPHADPSCIAMDYQGVDRLAIDPASSELIIVIGPHTLIDRSPFTFQNDGRILNVIECQFELVDDETLSFGLGQYDPALPLHIDPGLEFSTYFGGSAADRMFGNHCMAIDQDDSILITGSTLSTDIPATDGALFEGYQENRDAFIAKFDNDASELLFCTYFGGNGSDEARAVEIDSAGQIYIGGNTQSLDFPLTQDAFCTTGAQGSQCFLSVLDPTGSYLVYSTLIGSSHGSGAGVWDIALDSNADVYLAAFSTDADFPVTEDAFCRTFAGNYDLVAMKFSISQGILLYSTFIGGTGDESIFTVEVDSRHNAYISGTTYSPDFPVTAGAYDQTFNGGDSDAFLIGLNTDGSQLLFSTYIGGSGDDLSYDIDIDVAGSIWICGVTTSTDIPITDDAFQGKYTTGSPSEGYLARFSSDGAALLYSTYFGGTQGIYVSDIEVNGNVEPVIIGHTSCDDLVFPSTAFDTEYPSTGSREFIAWLNISQKRLINGTFFGNDANVFHRGMDLYLREDGHFIISGSPAILGFPVTPGSFDTTFNGVEDLGCLGLVMERTPWLVPTAPLNLSTEGGDGFVDLSWDPPASDGCWPISSYVVCMGATPGCETARRTIPRADSYSWMGLTNGWEYYFWISAVTIVGEGPLTAPVEGIPFALPTNPLNLTLVPGDRNITLTWEEPSDPGGLPILGYRILRGLSPDDVGPLVNLDNVTSYVDEDLTNGARYYYKVLAYHRFGDGVPTALKSAMPFGPPTVPQSLHAVAGNRQIILSWVAPQNDGGGVIRTYRIYRGYQADDLERHTSIEPALAYNDEDLANGLTYYYAISAVNDAGEGPRSDVVSATPLGPPGAPEDLTAEPSDGQVTLHWYSPVDTGGAPVTGYRVLRGTEPGALASVASIGPLDTYTDRGLTNGVTYHYQVRARTSVGEGAPSETASATPMGPPSAPVGLTAVPGDRQVELTWLPPQGTGGSPIASYRVYRGNGTGALELVKEIGATAAAFTDTQLVNGQTYRYAVSAHNGRLEGAPGDEVEAVPFGPPAAPRHLTLSMGDGTIELDWAAPEADGGRPLLGYRLFRGTSPTGLMLHRELGVTTAFTDDAIAKGTTYHYAVSAVNEAGVGPATETMSHRYITPPDVPAGLTTTSKGATATLAWRAPADTGGAAITGYRILRGNTSDDLALLTTVGDVLTYTDTTVERGKTYYYSVVAVNEVGDGSATAPLKVEVSKKPKDSPGFVTLLAVVGLLAVASLRAVRTRKGR